MSSSLSKPLLLILFSTTLPHLHLCEIFSINDRNYPHLFINDPVTAPVIWHKKAFGFRLANAAAVRINARGIRFIPGSHTLLLQSATPASTPINNNNILDDEKSIARQAGRLWWNDTLTDEEIAAQKKAIDRTQWRSITCKPSRESLCVLSSAMTKNSYKNVRSRFFPNYPNPVFLSQRDSTLLPTDVARMLGGSHCPESFTGRTAIAPQLASDIQQHDISLCNVIGLGADYIYVPYNNRLYVLTNPIDNALLVLMSIFVVYLMIVMGHNLQVVLNVNKNKKQPPQLAPKTDAKDDNAKKIKKMKQRRQGQARWAVVCMGSLLFITCFATGSSNILGAFVTLQDQIVFIASLVHIAYYCIRVEANVYLGDGRRANPVNPMLAAIAATVQRVYASSENPYSQTIFFIMLTWVLHKASMLNRKTLWPYHHLEENDTVNASSSIRWWRSMDILADCILIAIMLYAGVAGQVLTNSPIMFQFILFSIQLYNICTE
jgi:hypothetical protein